MNLSDIREPRIPKRHPACPGKNRCQLPSCIHNAPISRFSTDELSHNFYEANGMPGANPDITCVRSGTLYQRLSATSESGTDAREMDGEPKVSTGIMVCAVQMKIMAALSNILDRMMSCFH